MTEQVKSTRPEYDAVRPLWQLMRDATEGEQAVKAAKTTYLPMPSGFAAQPDKGVGLYHAYQVRAQFPEIVAPAVEAMVGVIHSREIKIDLPESLNFLWESATSDRLPLEAFHRRITAEILSEGRYIVLPGAPAAGGNPYLTGYVAESLLNWSDDRDFFVLDESGLERDRFVWNEHQKYRVLELVDGKYVVTVYEGDSLAETREAMPTARGAKPLTEIPLVVIGTRDLSLTPETPPLIGVARAAIAMYQLSADYRWQLFMTGQETLFVFNADAPATVGAGVVVSLKSTEGSADAPIPADARYVGPSGTGIEAHRQAIQDEVQKAAEAGAKLFNSGGNAAESGDALRIRFAAETASLTSIGQASCAGLEKALRHIGTMMGLSDADIESIVVHAPKTFIDRKLTPEQVQAIMGLVDKSLIAMETAYEQLQEGEWASPERDWKEESKLISDEEPDRPDDETAATVPTNQPA